MNSRLRAETLQASLTDRRYIGDFTRRAHRFMFGIIVLLLASPHLSVDAATVPMGFTETLVASGLATPTAMAFAPDGRLFVCQQSGQLRVIKDGQLLSTPFLTVTVNAAGERGLLGVAFDPAFLTNRYVYVYYTATTPTIHNRVSRFTAELNADGSAADVAVAGSEVVILELDDLTSATNHNGGAMHFGTDGKLYIATGENATAANAQSLANLLGKLLRINADGTIPSDNPFFSDPNVTGKNRAIWARGLRNPFTFAVQAGTGRIFINDVGQSTWEEINEGAAGANYGWPTCEGSCSNPGLVNPLYQYANDGSTCAITGGTFYNPSIQQFPNEYLGNYFFADYCGGWIRRLDAATGSVLGTFATGIALPVDLQVGPSGGLYYLARGGGGAVYKIEYTVNPTPTPTPTPSPISGYSLTASPSVVAPGGALSVSWTAPSGRPATDWIGLYRVGAPNSDFLWWQYTQGATSGTLTTNAPSEAGQYEFRYLLEDGYVDTARSNVVTIGSTPAPTPTPSPQPTPTPAPGSYSLTAYPNIAAPGGTLSVSWTAPSGRPSTDWIGLYRIGDANTSFLWWQYTQGATSGTFTLDAPMETGQYEFRYLLEDGYADVARSNTLTISSTPAPTPTPQPTPTPTPTPSPSPTPANYSLTASPSTTAAGGQLTVSWTAPAGRPSTDWIGLYRVGDSNGNFIWWQYTGGATQGNLTTTAPNEEGQYEFRYLLEDGYTDVARSNTVTVSSTPSPTPTVTLPSGFTASQVTSGLTAPMAMAFSIDGRLFVCEQGGQLRVIKNGVLLQTPFLTLSNIDASNERGLLGVAFDPNFSTNGYVYVHYTAATPMIHNRVSRFTAVPSNEGDVAVPNSETIIFELDEQRISAGQGGAMHFGADSKLYIAVGVNAYDATPETQDAQTLTNLWGKLLRINADGTIPSDNPFFSDPNVTGKNRATWARGLRVPFTFAVQPGTGRIFINDVGGHAWEEINEGIAGANYGWPDSEGATSDSRFQSPVFAYPNGSGETQGCSITGGAFYNPATIQFPSEYVGNYFFTDFCSGWVRKLDTATNTATGFATGLKYPVDLKAAPDGSLYYLERNSGTVHRIRYTG